MLRRELLLGLVTAPLINGPSLAQRPPGPVDGNRAGQALITALTNALLRPSPPAPDRQTDDLGRDDHEHLRHLAGELNACMRAFQTARYDVLTDRLPALIHRIDVLSVDRAPRLRAEIYNSVAKVLIKLETPGIGWVATDRALHAARASGDPAVVASCTRSAVSLCRRDGHYDGALDLALSACADLSVETNPEPGHLSLYGMLMCNAGYGAAQAGDRTRSSELLDLADAASRRLGNDRNEHWTAFGPTNVILHRISASFALGDSGTAIAYAATVNPNDLRLPERQSRYWVDVARAYQQWGKPERCYEALTIAERHAPSEVRSRPVVRRLTRELLGAPQPLPGIRDLAQRVGALT